MFDGASLEDMKNKPRLRDGEDTIVVAYGQLGDVVRKNVVVAVTTERIIVRPKRGRSVPDEESERGSVTVEFDEVDKIRCYGMVTKEIVVVCGDETHELPPLPNKSDEVVDAVVERAGLEETDWGDSNAARGTKALVATVGGGVGLLVGIVGVLIGIGMILTLVGLIFGVFLALGSALLTKGSWALLSWGYNKKEEYSRPSTP